MIISNAHSHTCKTMVRTESSLIDIFHLDYIFVPPGQPTLMILYLMCMYGTYLL